MNFFARNLQIFKRIGLPLFVLTLIYTSLDQLLTINTEEAMRSPHGANAWIWAYGLGSLIIGIIFPILGVLVVIYGAQNSEANERGLWDYVQHHVNQMSIEILRCWGKTLFWSILFILPGLWKYFEYTMVPFVVAMSKEYEQGKADALEASIRLVRSCLLKISAIILIFHLFFPSILTVLFDEYRLVWHTPVEALALTFIDVYLFIFSTQLLMDVFESQNPQEISNAAAHV
ncbi:MAG TPA: hypothetical protein VIG33_09950 [Pseudobdellovibrionaceae bacterium]